MKKTTFVTAFFLADSKRSIEWRQTHFKQLLESGIHLIFYTDSPEMAAFAQPYASCMTVQLDEPPLSNKFHHLRLPHHANPDKDTHEYMSIIHSKTILTQRAALWNPWSSDHFAWIDMSIFYIFKLPKEAVHWLHLIDKHIQLSDRILIPGCWPKSNVSNDYPCWRFCGGFFIGSLKAILDFGTTSSNHLETFLQGDVLSWEVNFWAWLEHKGLMAFDWYEADHNDSMLCSIPLSFFSCIIRPSIVHELNPILPCKEGYRPSSISYLSNEMTYGQTVQWILVRYVSYTIVNGCFVLDPLVPYSNISSLNYLVSIQVGNNGIELIEGSGVWLNEVIDEVMDEDSMKSLQGRSHDMSRGLEDVRMFSLNNSIDDNNDPFIGITGTNVDLTEHGIPNCFVGKLDPVTGQVQDVSILESDKVEKNWIPFSDKEFIYEWKRDHIVFIDIESRSKTQVAHAYPLLQGCRGSSCFVQGRDGLLYGIVHKVENHCYYHMIVVMNQAKEVVKCSRPFYYGVKGIQYCIGYWLDLDLDLDLNRHHFFLSIEDRDPVYIQVLNDDIEWIEAGLSGCMYYSL